MNILKNTHLKLIILFTLALVVPSDAAPPYPGYRITQTVILRPVIIAQLYVPREGFDYVSLSVRRETEYWGVPVNAPPNCNCVAQRLGNTFESIETGYLLDIIRWAALQSRLEQEGHPYEVLAAIYL